MKGDSMVITSSQLTMGSKHSYQQSRQITSEFSVTLQDYHLGEREEENTIKKSSSDNSLEESPSQLRTKFQTLHFLLRQFLQQRIRGGQLGFAEFIAPVFTQPIQLRKMQGVYKEVFMEKESLEFSTTGIAKTADGRELEFSLEVAMSRNFYQEIKEEFVREDVIFCDPLVIQLEDNPIQISDMSFYFDLDSDGIEEELKALEKGSGYLVYDKNQDGIINDGTEMFGTKSGNGFYDLSRYDEDKNGWIDEGDSIYSKLQVWYKKGDNWELIDLKRAKVGAIALQSTETPFGYVDESGQVTALMRKSGIYLTEEGNAKMISHLDYAMPSTKLGNSLPPY